MRKIAVIVIFSIAIGLLSATDVVEGKTEDKVLVNLDLIGTEYEPLIRVGFSSTAVGGFDEVSNLTSVALVPDPLTGKANNGPTEIYAYAQIVNDQEVNVYLRSSALNGFKTKNGDPVSDGSLPWHVTGPDGYSAEFGLVDGQDSDITIATPLITHVATTGATPVAQYYSKQLNFYTDGDFRTVSKVKGANYWQENLVVTIEDGN